MRSIPLVDYPNHPAFQQLPVTSPPGEEILAELNQIDQAMAEAPRDLAQGASRHWRRIEQLVDETLEDETLRLPTRAAVKNAEDALTAHCLWKQKRQERITGRRTKETKHCVQQLEEDGAAVLHLPDSVRRQLFELLADQRAETESRHRMKPIDRCTLHMRCSGPAFDLAWKTLQSTGIVTAVSDLFGRDVNPIYFYLAHNSARESWYQNCYADVDLPTSPFPYAHFDNDFDLAKIQIYLTDVGEENGPFAFVPGSHRWTGCKSQQFVFKEMDKAFKYPKQESLYYRPRFGCREHRENFLRLPLPLQGSSHFGDDVVEGTPLCERLRREFRTVTSDQGNCCVFAGGDLLHYGGLVTGADRWVVQFGLAAETPHSAGGPVQRSLLARLATKSRKYVGDEAINRLRRFLGYGDSTPSQSEYKPNLK